MRWVAILTLLTVLAGCSGEKLASVQTGPVSVTAPASPNWALGAPREVETVTTPTHGVPIYATGPENLLEYLDAIVLNEARVASIKPAWSPVGPARAYVQRSPTFGFPDVVSVEAIDLGAGDAGQRASLVIFSRAVYGYADLGVNRARIERWLSLLSDTVPIVAGRGLGG
ncbi:MAG: DUF1499 domain-containing protein [Paracoccaceae bacterium]